MTNKTKPVDPIHPGEILREDFLKPFGISINRLARDLDVPPNRISMIVNGERSITADTALRLGACFGMSPQMWLNLQTEYDRAPGPPSPGRIRLIRPLRSPLAADINSVCVFCAPFSSRFFLAPVSSLPPPHWPINR